jgi:hypothetical protein
MAQAVANDNNKTADYFGTVLLVDPNHQNVSVDEIWQSPFVVYPNPASDFIIIENAENALLEIFSPDGRLIRSVKIETGNNSIKISDIPSGMYIIHLTDEKQKYSQMIVKR